ncbi:MAG: pilus assembly protein PilM [Elusimicrobiales bacterium]|nr:pilus assembly protein PilM [Elusimicrobiales bacterium]
MKRFLDFIYPDDEIIGIDIGSYAIKIVLFSKNKDTINLKNWGYIPINLPTEMSHEEKKVAISLEISSFIKKHQIKVKYAATSISGNSVIIRYIKIPYVEPSILSDKIQAEAEAFIPFDVNDVYISYYVINPSIFEDGQNKMEIVLVAAKKDIIDEKINILTEAGLVPVLIDVDSFALENLINRIESPPEFESTGIVLINIGHRVSNFSVFSDNIFLVKSGYKTKKEYYSRLVRDIFVGGASIDRNFAKKFSLKDEHASEFKKTMKILVKDEDKMSAIIDYDKNIILGSKIISSVMKDLVSDINRSLDFLLSSVPDLNITKVYICGGSSSFYGIEDYLSSELKLPVKRIDPFSFLKTQPENLPDYVRNSLCVAAGLSLRSIRNL